MYKLLNPKPPEGGTLILIIRLCMEKLQVLGKDFPWEKPERCPECGSIGLWGHGYVLRYFHEIVTGLWIKRYRCPDCHAVHTLRPFDYSPGFQYSWTTIQNSIQEKKNGSNFLKTVSRQCQQYWFKAYRFQQKRQRNFTVSYDIPSSQKDVTFRINYHEIPCTEDPPYLPFAVTVKPSRFSFK